MNNAPHETGCQAMRMHLDAYLAHELPEETRQEVERHLESCPACAAELETRARIRTQLQAAVRAASVPAGLDNRIRLAVQDQDRHALRRPRTGLWAVAAAAAVILCALLLSRMRTEANPEEAILRKTPGRLAVLLNVGLRDHLQCAVFRTYPRQPIPAAQMAAELGPDFADLAPVVQAKLPGDFRVIQGHQCEAGGRQFTHFIIAGGDRGAKTVSLLLTRRRPGESFSGGIQQAGVDRFQVVGFESHDYLAYVISDLDALQNLQWAASLAPSLREYLAAHGSNTWGGSPLRLSPAGLPDLAAVVCRNYTDFRP